MITVRVGLASDQRLSGPGSVHQSAFGSEFRAGFRRSQQTSLAVEITQYIETDDTSLQEPPSPLSLKPDTNTYSPGVRHMPSDNSIPLSYAI